MKLKGTAVVVSPGGALTSMGRVLALAELLESVVERVSVYTQDSRPLWPPSSRWDVEIRRGGNPALVYSHLNPPVSWVWPVKPLRSCHRAAASLLDANLEAHLILDVDDDDEALTREFLASNRPLGGLRLFRTRQHRQLLPRAISHARSWFLSEAAAFSTSSYTLARRCGLPESKTFRVIHPRSRVAEPRSRNPDPKGLVHLGFFGNVRPHKGIREIAALLEANPDFRLHLFSGYDRTGLGSIREQIVEHPADGSRVEEAASVDAVLLPQERTSAGMVQVPTKLIDAMRFGVPAFVTPTEAIREVGGDTLHYLDNWDDPVASGRTLRRLLVEDESRGDRARELFESELSTEAMAPELRKFLKALDGQREVPARRLAASARASR